MVQDAVGGMDEIGDLDRFGSDDQLQYLFWNMSIDSHGCFRICLLSLYPLLPLGGTVSIPQGR